MVNYQASEDTLTNKTKYYRILALDGGGIRGLITAVWLHRLEKELEKKVGKKVHIRDFFDLIAGTSTGSILACAISLGTPTEELIKIYKNRGKEIFTHSKVSRFLKWLKHLRFEGLDQPIYSDKGLEKVLRDEFGECKFGELNEGSHRTTFVVSYDTLNRRAICFNSSQDRYDALPVWEICKASSSAPVYFPAHVMQMKNGDVTYNIPLIDGGVVASNPTACAIAEGIKIQEEQEPQHKRDIGKIVVVSLGTGDSNRPIRIKQAQRWGLVKWSLNITGVLFDGVSQAMDHVATNLLPTENYFRFQAKLDRDSLDDVSEENLNALQALANSYFETNICKEKLKDLIPKLLNSDIDANLYHEQMNLSGVLNEFSKVN